MGERHQREDMPPSPRLSARMMKIAVPDADDDDQRPDDQRQKPRMSPGTVDHADLEGRAEGVDRRGADVAG